MFSLSILRKRLLPTTSLLSDHSLMPFFFPVPHDTRYVSTCRVGVLAVPATIKRYHIESLTLFVVGKTTQSYPRRAYSSSSSFLSFGQWRKHYRRLRLFHSQPKFGTRSVQVSRQNRRLHIDHRVYHSVL